MLTDAAVFQRQEIISPLSFGLDKTIFQLTVNFVFVPAIPTIHSFLFLFFFISLQTMLSELKPTYKPQCTAAHLAAKYFCAGTLTQAALVLF